MHKTHILGALAALALATPAAHGQFTLPTAGSHEFTLGGSGVTDDEFDDSAGGVNFSYGKYTTDRMLWSLRQTINYTNPEDAGSAWNGSTVIAGDYHFGDGRLRPLVGANLGYVYGESVEDTWAAGLEAGLKYYVQDRTFVYGMVEYAWLFDDAEDIDNTFDNGRYVWSVGVGFNF